ncbi:MAG: hypothetical protein H6R10_134 [Rhodocyclaceae bacterium]|nr:hypothetical protein [Rhodocyclaceae bacterium]
MPHDTLHEPAEKTIKSILEWLARAHSPDGLEDASGLRRLLLALRATSLPVEQRLKLLDPLYDYAAKLVVSQFPSLHQVTLPVSRQTRQLVRAIQDVLEILAQDYLDAQVADPETAAQARPPIDSLRPTMQCLSWHLTISHLVAAPTGAGIWQQLHSTFRICRRLGLDQIEGPAGASRIERIYLSSLLLSVVQPASFTSQELEFIGQYIDHSAQGIEISSEAPPGHEGIFWIDSDRDSPPHALARRVPPPETPVLYFACDTIARRAADHLAALEGGHAATDLDLPPFADSPAGHGVLKRLIDFWGHPAKRKFPRRRQSYRADLCAGLDRLWQLLQSPSLPPSASSEWMITNESPDGYAMMHVAGATEQLRVGDIVALQPRRGEASSLLPWQICIVRWALSENPEHIELGLQVLSGQGIPARLALPHCPDNARNGAALLLPKAPPLRPSPALVAPTGLVGDWSQKLILVVEQDNVAVHELRAIHLDEQTSSIEVFTVEPDERP